MERCKNGVFASSVCSGDETEASCFCGSLVMGENANGRPGTRYKEKGLERAPAAIGLRSCDESREPDWISGHFPPQFGSNRA